MCLLLRTTAWQEGPGRRDPVLQSPGNGAGKARAGRCQEGGSSLPPRSKRPQPQQNPALGGQGGPQICLWRSPWLNQCAGQIRLPKGSKGLPGEKEKERKTIEKREEMERVILDLRALADPVMVSPRLLSFAVPVSGSIQGLTTAFLGQAGLDSGLFSSQAWVCTA